jgi:hypoxanthine phosphoribosyltransferase
MDAATGPSPAANVPKSDPDAGWRLAPGHLHARAIASTIMTGARSLPEASAGTGAGDDHWGDDPHIGRVVVSQEQIRQRVGELGAQITADYADRPPLLVGVLKGAFIFMADLTRAVTLPVEIDLMAIASYGSDTTSSGVVRIMKDVDADLVGRDVLVVEDIVDSGVTLSYLRRYLWAHGPATLEVCALLVKSGLQRRVVDLRYVGFTIPPDFVIGYGLDVDQKYRNLADICIYRPHGTSGE